MARAGDDDVRARVRRRMAEDGIPVGSDDPTLQALGAPPLHTKATHVLVPRAALMVLRQGIADGEVRATKPVIRAMIDLLEALDG